MKFLLFFIGVSLIASFLVIPIQSVQAQIDQSGWVPVQQVPGYLDDTFTPVLLADRNRTVHAFANQWAGDDERQPAIYYRKWSMYSGWTSPVDVILWEEGEIIIQGSYLDKDGWLHIIFWGGKDAVGNLYYSRAPVNLADRAPVWSEPKLVGSSAIYPASAKLQGDGEGNLIAIYSSHLDKSGVYYIRSIDGGLSWSEPVPIYFTDDIGYIPYSIQMATDAAQRIHAVWSVVDSTGNDLAILYSRYQPNTDKWSEPFLLEKRVGQKEFFGPSFPSIAISDKRIVVFYNSGNPNPNGYVGLGRPVQLVRISEDGGDTWIEVSQPFPLLQGRSGEHALVVDSNGVFHAIFIQRIDRTINGQYLPIGGIWHSEYRDNSWSEPERISIPIAAHDIRAVVSQGNVLLATWRADPGVGALGLYYTYKLLDAPELAVEIPPSVTADTGELSEDVITSTQPSFIGSVQPNASVPIDWASKRPVRNSLNPNILLAMGVGPVILLVATLILIRRFKY